LHSDDDAGTVLSEIKQTAGYSLIRR